MSHDVVFTTARLTLSPEERDAADAFCAALDGADVDDIVFVCAALIDDDDWRPWMLPGALHVCRRSDVVELLRRLGPLVSVMRRRKPSLVVNGAADVCTVDERRRSRRRVSVSAPCSPFEVTAR